MNKKHKHLAKQFFIRYKYPIQRKHESRALNEKKAKWDVAICYSTDEDDPIFVKDCINADKKYVFVHQSTRIDNQNMNAMKKYDAVISVNPLLIPWIKSMVNNLCRVLSLENYVDYNRIVELANERTACVFPEATIIATCGRLCSTKGYDYVAQIAKELKNRNISFVWLWIGDGPARGDMERLMAQYGLENEIALLGNQMNPYQYINACEIYIQPSRAEMYPLTILESLVLQKPIVSTNTAGGEYILHKHNCGFLVDDPVKEIPDVIENLIMSPELLKEEKKKTMQIDWEADRKRYLEQWDQLLSGTIEIFQIPE